MTPLDYLITKLGDR